MLFNNFSVSHSDRVVFVSFIVTISFSVRFVIIGYYFSKWEIKLIKKTLEDAFSEKTQGNDRNCKVSTKQITSILFITFS